MKLIQNFLSDSVINAFGWTLIHSTWQGMLLFIFAVSAFYLFRRKSANFRYIAGVSLLMLQVLASVVTFAIYLLKTTPVVASENSVNAVRLTNSPAIAFSSYELPLSLKMQIWISAHLNELVICWLIGAAVLLLRFAGGWIFTERLRRNAKIVMNREWRARFGVIIAKMNITQSVEFRESAKVLTPMVIGALSPVVLIPIGLLSGFSTTQVEAILAHELAHIRRNDYFINLLQSFVEVVFFFHPVIWWLSNRIRIEREHCCDDIALTVCGDKMSLAHALVKVAEWQTAPSMAMAFASKKPLLLQRVQRVLGIQPKPSRTLGTFPVMLFVLSLVIGLSVYAVAQKETKQEKPKKVTKYVTKKRNVPPRQVDKDEFEALPEVPEISEIAEITGEPLIEIDFDDMAGFSSDNDSLSKKMNEFHQKMQAFQNEMEPYRHRIEELRLEMEKQRFEVERFEREREKIEWKKDRASDVRSDLMEKRSDLFDRGDVKADQSNKSSESEMEKQLADFEQQIKTQEQTISELNSQITASRREALKAEEPMRKLEAEMRELENKMGEIGSKMEKESEFMGNSNHNKTLQVARMPKPPRPPKTLKAIPAPTAPAAPPAPIKK